MASKPSSNTASDTSKPSSNTASDTSKPFSNTASDTTSEKTKELRDLVIEASRVQLAAMTSMVKLWSGWAQSAEKYTQAMSDELAKVDEEGNSETALGRLGDLTREYLRELGTLPSVAAKQFSGEIERFANRKGPRNRAAKAKP